MHWCTSSFDFSSSSSQNIKMFVTPSLSVITNTLKSFGWNQWVYLLSTLVLCCFVARISYNLFFHPLSKFPGPINCRASMIPWAWQFVRGHHPYSVFQMHNKYGPIVRISPTEISFSDPKAWHDIYGNPIERENPKYQTFFSAVGSDGVLSAEFSTAGKQTHKVYRSKLTNEFSNEALRKQEGMIMEHVDLMIEKIRARCNAALDSSKAECEPQGVVLDISEPFSWFTCDVIGTLAFGKSFGCLQNSRLTPYVAFLHKAGEVGGSIVALWYLGLGPVVKALQYIFGGQFEKVLEETRAMLKSRIETGYQGRDSMEPIIRAHLNGELTFNVLLGSANSLITAGSETQGWSLSSFLYCMAAHPHCLHRLMEELQSAFDSEAEICLSKTEKLTYLNACIKESMRLYPSLVEGIPRSVAKGGRFIAGRYIPEGSVVSINHYVMSHLDQHFHRPFEFHPERFLGDKAFAGDRLEAFQGFGVGPRNCVGRNLVYTNLRLILPKFLWNFDIELTPQSKNWVADQKCWVVYQQIPLMMRVKPVRRGSPGA